MQLVIGLGGNRGDVARAFSRALDDLARGLRVLARSGVWRSAPQGPPQPDYLNAAVLVETDRHPAELLALCQRLETAAGRDRTREERWGPRTLDLDLLLAPGLVIESIVLTLPHPRLDERRFALAPAAEAAPGWRHPRLHRTLPELAARPAILVQRCERIGPFPTAPAR
ncbi:MAG: 2-amino-4-hydroxy-6-hydroxymethyldihydropteridine diphosphokinase [Thermoanaerobaculaceae bacterium]|nr:2-amino-4-hydroxy-6-hydroxymethyldihydropteridine diphosphokinase [Thermoanaerobaculaceae bacterium]TAM49003.1 MAG: 2-amino-4-hydroxy-6-hydroxymethyldihydropteridine diphosphokinase [Acidobacteriota bacterium]